MYNCVCIAACVLQFPFVLLVANISPRVAVDVFKTSVHVVSDALGNSSYIYRPKPVDIDMLHNVNVTPLFLLLSAMVAAFVLLTRRMVATSESDGLSAPFSVDNSDVALSPGVVMWNMLFIFIIAAVHVGLVLIINTPCSVDYMVLSSVLTVVPLAAVSLPQPLHGTRHVYNAGDTIPPPLFCGFPPHVAYVSVFAIATWYNAGVIAYDPTGLKLQAAAATLFLDLFALCLGHLWDSPPSVTTIVNTRLFYCCCVSAGNIAVVVTFNSSFPTHYTP